MTKFSAPHSALTPDDIQAVSPALASYTQKAIAGDLWNRPGLSRRDRSIVTVSALIARIQTIGMLHYFNIALDSGVKPTELSEIVTHLAFYTGWSTALSAVPTLKEIFAERGIGADQLPDVSPQLLPLDETAEAQRASTVEKNSALWLRELLYTLPICCFGIFGSGQRLRLEIAAWSLSARSLLRATVAKITYHLNRAMDHGLTQAQASEMLTHLAFYAGWPNAFSALPVAKEVFEKRSN